MPDKGSTGIIKSINMLIKISTFDILCSKCRNLMIKRKILKEANGAKRQITNR